MKHILDRSVVDQIRQLGGEKLFAELAGLYLEHTPVRMKNLAEGRREGDLARIEKAAHSLRSSSVSLGAVGIAEEAAVVERLARSGVSQGDDLGRRIDSLEQSVGEVLLHLQKEYSGERA